VIYVITIIARSAAPNQSNWERAVSGSKSFISPSPSARASQLYVRIANSFLELAPFGFGIGKSGQTTRSIIALNIKIPAITAAAIQGSSRLIKTTSDAAMLATEIAKRNPMPVMPAASFPFAFSPSSCVTA
jgi:hypothetical protein